jgi:GT2 family glycosyltransferase
LPEPLFSIIIANWNGERFLKKCLSSIRAQGFKDFEVILVDNGSVDDSLKLVREGFPEVKVIRNAENLGFAAANNQGIRAAGGKYILTLNNDTELVPTFLARMADAVKTSGETTGMWAAKILSSESRGIIDSVGGLLIYPDGLAKGRGRLERDSGQYDVPEEVFIPSACAGFYSKKMLDEVGLFDEDFFAYCEDVDLGFRARLAGWKTRNVPAAVVYHYYSGTGGRYTPFKAYLVERNHLWLAVKNMPFSMLARVPFYTLWRFIVQGYGVLTGKGAGGKFVDGFSAFTLLSVLVKAYIDALRRLPRLLVKRGRVRRLRKTPVGEVKKWFKSYGISAFDLVLKD